MKISIIFQKSWTPEAFNPIPSGLSRCFPSFLTIIISKVGKRQRRTLQFNLQFLTSARYGSNIAEAKFPATPLPRYITAILTGPAIFSRSLMNSHWRANVAAKWRRPACMNREVHARYSWSGLLRRMKGSMPHTSSRQDTWKMREI